MKRTLLRMLEQRFGSVPSTIRGGVESLRSVQKLERLIDRALTARTLDEMRIV